jgi:hypothetical protein
MCRLSIGIEGLPRIIGPSKAAASPHKGGTRWNNAIFVEEEPMETKRRRIARRRERNKERKHADYRGLSLNKRERERGERKANKRTKGGRRLRRETKNVEESDGLPAQNVDAASLSVTIVWMSSS